MTGKERARLRSLANTIQPVIYIGKDGITDNTVREVNDALEARELIKGCVQQGAPVDAKEAITALAKQCAAEPIQFIGRRFVLYRKNPKNPKIEKQLTDQKVKL